MAEFPAHTPWPSKVHERARSLIRFYPSWSYRRYDGGIYSVEHFRVCTYCGCIHPGDLIGLLNAGHSTFHTANKARKYLLVTPNPVAGNLVRMGSAPGTIFPRGHEPLDLRHRLAEHPKRGLTFVPSPQERLSGHFDRPALEIAPTVIVWPFYAEHTNDQQWPEIWAAASRGTDHEQTLPSAASH